MHEWNTADLQLRIESAIESNIVEVEDEAILEALILRMSSACYFPADLSLLLQVFYPESDPTMCHVILMISELHHVCTYIIPSRACNSLIGERLLWKIFHRTI